SKTITGTARLLESALPAPDRQRIEAEAERLTDLGAPDALARRIALLPALAEATDIHLVTQAIPSPLPVAASVYFAAGATFRIGDVARLAAAVPLADPFDLRVHDRASRTLAD